MIGYLQGMNDLLVPIIILMKKNRTLTFWCFAGLMDMMQKLFDKHHAKVQDLMKKTLIYLEVFFIFFLFDSTLIFIEN